MTAEQQVNRSPFRTSEHAHPRQSAIFAASETTALSDLHESLGHRILVIDDNPKIHADFKMILSPSETNVDFERAEAALFGESEPGANQAHFEIDSAFQGQEGLAMVEQAMQSQEPYSLAFVDVRMPPGWDGIETIGHLWKSYPELQVVICTAYSDYSWENIVKQLGQTDNLLILKKPFDNVEVLQLAHALTKKWWLNRKVSARLANLDELVKERTRELSEANQRLRSEMAQREQAQRALRESEARFSTAFRASPIPLAILSVDHNSFQEVNDSFLLMCASPRDAVRSLSFSQLTVFPDQMHQQMVEDQFQVAGPMRKIACQIRRPTGELRDALFSAEPLSVGCPGSWLIIAEDITDQLQLETQLRQAQKMEAIGQLAAGVAHDFNNILTVIQGHASLQLQNAELEDRVARSFRKVEEAARRAASLTGQLLAFSRQQRIRVTALNLNELLQKFHEILARCINENILLKLDCARDLPRIEADRVNIEQIIMNLSVNARDAMPNGGLLTIRTSAVELAEDIIHANAEARAGKFVCLSIEDNGYGMDTATRERIFEPFFTTKEIGKGTGLGLATVYGIVKQHEGWIEVESTLGIGTTFRIFLPAFERPEASEPNTPPAQTPHHARVNHERILVVEDEPVVRELVCQTLAEAGYQVVAAADGIEALKTCAATSKPFDLLLTDMVMPNGISGVELARKLKHKLRTLKVIYMSGYSPDWAAHELELIPGVNFIPKPYTSEALLAIVRRCLAAAR